jgi:hypothetical protein
MEISYMLTENFDKDNYNATEKFMTAKKANLLSFLLLFLLYIGSVAIYLLWHDYENIFAAIVKSTFLLEVLILAVGVFLFLFVAIIAKAFMLSVFAEGGFDSVKFKMIKETQKPYCNLKEPVKVRQYRICLAVYILIIGIMPYIVSLIIGDFIFVLASFVCMYFAAADILFLIFLFAAKGGSYVIDFDGIMLYRIYEKIIEK